MASKLVNTQVKINRCSKCQGDTAYHCRTCGLNLCPPCKRKHTISIDTKEHIVILYREKFNKFYNNEMCATHPDQVYNIYCESCDLPICLHCTEHSNHRLQNARTVYENKRKQKEKELIKIRSETLYSTQALRVGIKSNVTTTPQKLFSKVSIEILAKSQRLKEAMECEHMISEFKLKGKYLIRQNQFQKRMQIKRHVCNVQKYEYIQEKKVNKPVQFLRFIKRTSLPKIQDTPRLSQGCLLSLTQGINMKELINVFSTIQISAKGKRLLQIQSSPVFQKTLTVNVLGPCYHISCMSADQIFVSAKHEILLTGDKLYSVKDSAVKGRIESGNHTVNADNDLFYIDTYYNIKKLSNDRRTTSIVMKRSDSSWTPVSVFCSPYTEDLLVGMKKLEKGKDGFSRSDKNDYTPIGKVSRYDNTGQLTQTISHKNSPQTRYGYPSYITENMNGDVVVSDLTRQAVIVTSREGIYRFSYTGPPKGPALSPGGICTDALSHILVCDLRTKIVHMLGQNGAFLSYLLTIFSTGIGIGLQSLGYDIRTHQLLVGLSSTSNMQFCKVSVYRYLKNRNSFTGKCYIVVIY